MSQNRSWILLRGLARGTGHWGSFVERIKEKFPHDQFELLDLPGNGARAQEQSPLKISDYVKDLRQQSQFIRDGKTVNILSVSLGSMITVEWMSEFPHEIKKAYLVCTSSAGFSPFYHRFQVANYAKAARLFSAQKNEIKWENAILEMVTNSHERRKAEVLGLAEYTKQHPMQLGNVFRQMWAASQYRFPKQNPGDVTLIGSYGDRLVAPACTMQIGRKWGLHPLMHPWAGHDIPVDDPEWLLEQVL